MKNILFAVFFCFSQLAFSQRVDFLKIGKYKIAILSDSLKENSGLNFFNGKLYTFNDGGNSSEIFEVEKSSGKILKSIKTNLSNQDWEAITSDSTNIYIGDFGNNAGTRKDLKIYKIPPDSINQKLPTEIRFYYPEQQDFTPKLISQNFDAEAMIFLNGKIHLFTKEWFTRATTHYIINPEIPDLQGARKIEIFKTGFFVTDASYFNKNLYVIGYTKKTEVFLYIFKEAEPGIFFSEKPKRFYLGSALNIGQIEGIAVNSDGIYIAGEEFRTPIGTAKPQFYFIPKEKLRLPR